MIFNRRDLDTKQRFGIRKLSVGVCSVLLSTLFLTFNTNQLVHADSTDKNNTGAQTTEVTRDPQSARNSKSTSHIEQNQFQSRSEAADTQASETKDLAQTKTNKTDLEIAVKSSDKTEEKQSELELTQVKKPTEEQKSTVSPANLDKENQTEIETTTLKLDKANAGKLDAKVFAESKVTTQEDTTPILLSTPDSPTQMVVAGSTDNTVLADSVSANDTPAEVTVNYTKGQQVTFEFVDDDESGKVVESQSQVFIEGVDTTITPALSLPKNYQLAKDQSIPTGYSLPEDFTDADLVQQIHLVHAHGVTSQYTSRQITVHYVYGAGEHAGEQAAQDAVLDIYYKRTGDTDLVTNTMAADAPWLFDSSYNEDGYQNGYKVVSGDWSQLPTNWANVVASVPTIDGYKAFTSGDWTKVGSNVSTVAANEFVNPAYNTAGEGGETISGKNSIAYTDAAIVYEATANHTIYYVPAKQTETRTVKKYFKLYDPTTNTYKAADVITLSDGTKQDYGQIDIYYDRQATRFATNGSTDPSKWTTSYGDWNVDTTRGNLGVKVVSGSWSDNLTAGSQGSINMPSLPGYTVVSQSSDLGFLTYNVGQINGGSESFTGTTGPWYYRNSTTTFYVPNSLLQKTITRTINIEGQNQPITQQVTFYRTAFINADDTEIVLAAVVDNNVYKREFGDNVWNHESTDKDGIPTGTWNRVDVTKPGYTAIVDDQAVTEVAADSTVNPNMSNATVNVTYIKNAGTITINHAKVDKTYSGDPTETTIPNDITHAIDKTDSRITWPTGAEDVTLDNSDFSFANEDGTALTNIPVNVGTYHIILNQNGINKFKNLDPDFTWYYDPKTSYVVYKINKAVPNVTFQGAGTKTYDGTAINNYTTPIGLAITDAPNAGENSITLTAGTDYVWYATDAQGHKVGEAIKTAPVNVGNYAIELTDTGKNAIKNATANANNLDWAKAKISGTGTYKITEATAKATLSGENSRDYNGLAVSTDDLYAGTNGNITVTIAIPNSNETISYTLKNDDYTWDTPDHVAPTDQGTYTFTLNKDEVLAGLQAAIAADPAWKGNVGISADDLTGSATFTINPATGTATLSGSAYKTYDGKDVSLDDLNSPDGDIEVKFTHYR
ncbi:MBG domain-containing protein [Lactobacillus xujianguonis]|uniref:MBG domain-containing protein n=1 Tax=Lactobacillus xujianguonis TaxID=2495899 RepID=UPI000FD85C2C|nr:MBG domain-containing protein [Lactobacillus xujianguonis]RVU73771.1 YSIRK-type signal peptide-containing protein [Lactobacillus xujianguonis]